jgi:hypothetical protein
MVLKFHEYLSKRDGISLDEAARRSLARAWQLSQTGHTLALISASRSENPHQVNLARTQQLANDLRQLRFGFTPVHGGTIENVRDPKTGHETGEKQKVLEDSFLVSIPADVPPKMVKQRIIALLMSYQQESAVVKYADSDHAFLLTSSGAETNIGRWSKDNMSQFFTQMKYGANAQNRSFAFEYADDLTRSTQMAIQVFERNNSGH